MGWLEKKFKELQCKHQYEILSEFNKKVSSTRYMSWIDYYKLYCPYCDKTIEKEKESFDNIKYAEAEAEELQKKKEEIKKRVLGEIK